MMKLFYTILISTVILNAMQAQDEYLIREIKKHKDEVVSVAVSNTGQYVVSGSEDKTLLIYNIELDEVAYEYPDNYFVPRGIVLTATNHIFLGSGSDIKQIDFNNSTLAVYEGNATHINSIAYAAERSKLTAGSYDYTIKVWDVETREMELELTGHKKSTLPVAFSPDEKYIVSGSLDKTVRLWNAKTGEEMRILERHSGNIYDVAFHPSGKYFASASADKTIRLWDFESGDVLMTYTGHDNAVTDIEFLPDGNHLVSASYDGSIRLWQTKSGKMVYTYTGHEGTINSIALSANGKIMASGGVDTRVLVWEVSDKIFVEYQYYNEFHSDKESLTIFDPKRKGEKKEDYEKRVVKAQEKESEIIQKYMVKYNDYVKTLHFK